MCAIVTVVLVCLTLSMGAGGCVALSPTLGHSLDVPFVASSEGDCGVACVAMVLRYVGTETDPKVLYGELYVPVLGGSTAALLADSARRRGMRATAVQGTAHDLVSWLDQGVAPIVLLRASDLGKGHFAVVTGVSRKGDVRVHSGQKSNMWYRAEQFEALWTNGRRTTVLIERLTS